MLKFHLAEEKRKLTGASFIMTLILFFIILMIYSLSKALNPNDLPLVIMCDISGKLITHNCLFIKKCMPIPEGKWRGMALEESRGRANREE